MIARMIYFKHETAIIFDKPTVISHQINASVLAHNERNFSSDFIHMNPFLTRFLRHPLNHLFKPFNFMFWNSVNYRLHHLYVVALLWWLLTMYECALFNDRSEKRSNYWFSNKDVSNPISAKLGEHHNLKLPKKIWKYSSIWWCFVILDGCLLFWFFLLQLNIWQHSHIHT